MQIHGHVKKNAFLWSLAALAFASGLGVGAGLCDLLSAKQRALGRLYTAKLGLSIDRDVRALTLINGKQVDAAAALLRMDLESSVNSLAALTNFVRLNQSQTRELREGLGFLAEEK